MNDTDSTYEIQQEDLRRILSLGGLFNVPPASGFIAIDCSTCVPPSVVHVPEDAAIELPYSCTACIKRGLHRLENLVEPHRGRLKHGVGS